VRKNNSIDYLFTPQKQSPVAILLILYKFLTQVLKSAFPVVLIIFFNPNKSFDGIELLLFILISVASTVLSIAAYYKFEYFIRNDEIIIQKGIIKKINLDVPFDRIQAINTNQTFLHRIFNVASLEIDTAGSKNNEIKIDAISLDRAEALKDYILKQKEQLSPLLSVDQIVVKEEDNVLMKLDFLALLIVGIGQNHMRSIAIITFFFIGLSQYADILIDEQQLSEAEQIINDSFQSIVLILIPTLIIASLVLTLSRTVLKYYDLRFIHTPQGYKLVSGLFTRNEKQAALPKIQLVGWHTNPLKRIFSMFELNLSQAFSTNMVRAQTMQIPGVYRDQLQLVCNSYFPIENRVDMIRHRVSPRLMIRTFSFYVIPLLLIASSKIIIPEIPIDWWVLIASLLFSITYTYVSWRKWNIQVGANGLLVQRGFLKITFLLLQWNKIQGLRIRQSIFQKNRSLADLHLFTAAGIVKLPYLKQEVAEELRDYILYYVETDNEPWM